jgi:hypothetical protein
VLGYRAAERGMNRNVSKSPNYGLLSILLRLSYRAECQIVLLPIQTASVATSNRQMEQLRLCRKIHHVGTIEGSIIYGNPTDP